MFEDDTVDDGPYGLSDNVKITDGDKPKGAWRKALRIVLRHHKRSFIPAFILGIIALAFEIGAYAVIVEGSNRYLAEELDTSGSLFLMAAGAVLGLLVLSATSSYALGLYIARIRYLTFARTIDDAVTHIRKDPFAPFVRELGTKGAARTLRRESRYLSRALTDIALMPRPFLILGLILGLGFWKFPIFTAICLGIVLLTAPIYLRVSRWGSDTMNELLENGQGKGQADQALMTDILETLEPVDGPSAESLRSTAAEPVTHSRDPDVDRFLDTYRRRMTLGPTSQLVTQVTTAVLFACLGGYALYQLANGQLSVPNLLMLVFGLKIGMQTLSALMQAGITVASYAPLISHFADFVYPKVEPERSPYPAFELDGFEFPQRALWIGKPGLSRILAANLSHHWNVPQNSLVWLLGKAPPARPTSETGVLYALLKDELSGLDYYLHRDIIAAAKGKPVYGGNALANDIVSLIDARAHQADCAVVWDARQYSNLILADRAKLLDWMGGSRLLVVHASPPKRAPGNPVGPIMFLHNGTAHILPSDAEYGDLRKLLQGEDGFASVSDIGVRADAPILSENFVTRQAEEDNKGEVEGATVGNDAPPSTDTPPLDDTVKARSYPTEDIASQTSS